MTTPTKKELEIEHINACVIAGICPICNSELIIVENENKTHKFKECSDDKSHYHVIVGYVTDED